MALNPQSDICWFRAGSFADIHRVKNAFSDSPALMTWSELRAPSSHFSTSCRCNSDSLTNSSCQVGTSMSSFYVVDKRIIQPRLPMSAFPESGRSDHRNLNEIRVRFRPIAVVREVQKARHSPEPLFGTPDGALLSDAPCSPIRYTIRVTLIWGF